MGKCHIFIVEALLSLVLLLLICIIHIERYEYINYGQDDLIKKDKLLNKYYWLGPANISDVSYDRMNNMFSYRLKFHNLDNLGGGDN